MALNTKKKNNIDSFTSPESSSCEGGVYDKTDKSLVIAFKNKKDPNTLRIFYSYQNVEEGDWIALKSVISKGAFIQGYFTKRYKGVVVGRELLTEDELLLQIGKEE